MRDSVERVRKALQQWDDGLISLGEFESLVRGDREFVDLLEKGEELMAFGSCCCSGHPPDRTFKVEITIQPHGYTAKRCA